MAIHAGEATEQDGDYLGTTVNRAARLRGVADGGEIVVSSSVANLVADLLPFDTTLRSVGPVHLPDIDRREEVFVLTGPGLPAPASGRRGEPEADLLGEKGVTKRERDVFDALADRLTNAEVAARFSISERTVETHVSALLRKLGAANRVELAALAKENRSTPVELPPMLLMRPRRSVCVGRREERSRLVDCWTRSSGGQTALVVVSGEAGIGKSRLVAELATDVHHRSGRVLFGASTDGAHTPYQPFVEALRDTIAGVPEGQLRADVGRHVDPLARVLPDVAARLGTTVRAAGLDPLSERQASQAAIAALLIAMARRQPTLLVLEDMHWASSLTREAVLLLARTGGAAPLLIVATTRDTAPELDPTLLRWLADAARLPVCDMVPLAGLDLEASAELVDELGGTIDPASALHQTGGNPLFLREVAASGTTSPTLRDFLADRYAEARRRRPRRRRPRRCDRGVVPRRPRGRCRRSQPP